jgi:geranylgeranylglycerol-phosphate geranylgeranyltransferase
MVAGFLKLMRLPNCLMTALAVLVGAVLVLKLGAFFNPATYMAMVAAFLIAGAGNAINDYVDVAADKVNRPYRPIPSGRVGRRAALAFSVLLFLVGIALALMINVWALAIAVINSVLLVLYSTHIKERMLLGNASISYLVGSGFLFGGAAMGDLMLPFIMFLLAAFANMAREVAKDLEDIKGDRLAFLKKAVAKAKSKVAHRFNMDLRGNVRLRYRPRVLSVVAAVCLAVAIAVSPAPFVTGMLGYVYLAILVPTDLVFLYAVFLFSRREKKKREYSRISRTVKLGMLLGLLAFLLGALI